jgi:mannose-6-phosphate isomerase
VSLARLKTYFIDTILPNWLAVAFDEEAGQFVEALDLDGAREKTGIVRVRSAARQIYVYAHAAALGVAPADALAKAERAFESLHANAWTACTKTGYMSAFNMRTGEITDRRCNLYDHACVLLALAWLSRATGNGRYAQHIAETVRAIDTTLAAPFGGWAEDDEGSLPRRQNPHMHYFEACLALWETGHGGRYAARAGEIFSLFRSRFYDQEIGTLREFFGPAWEISDAFKSGRLDPGHMAEWTWLLSRYEKLAWSDLSALTVSLMDTAIRLGRTRTAPFLVDEMSVDGTPLVNRRRLWPQAELLKAYIVRAAQEGGHDYGQTADRIASLLFETYLARAPHGTWRDAFDLDGNFIATQIPGSSLYHLWTVVAELYALPAGGVGGAG